MKSVIPVRNAWHMLLYAWDMLAWRGQWDAAAEESPGMLGLLARVLVDATRPLLRRELARSFVEQREMVSGVRGKIDFSASLKRLAFEAGRAHCTYAALDIDTPRNRILPRDRGEARAGSAREPGVGEGCAGRRARSRRAS